MVPTFTSNSNAITTTFNTNLVGGNESVSGTGDVKSGVATINNGTNLSINIWGPLMTFNPIVNFFSKVAKELLRDPNEKAMEFIRVPK
jgi:hypothetical protein